MEMGPQDTLPPPDVYGILNLMDHAEASKAIIVAGIVEDWLQTMLLGAGRSLSNSQLSDFFEGYGPLSSFSAKIDISYFFKLVDDTTYRDLKAIKNIRNCFAHTKEIVTFKNDEVKKRGQALTNWTKTGDLRDLYYDRAQSCLNQMRGVIESQIIVDALNKPA
jgi:DNA-binding MltR family transcriptional regulator